MDPLLRAAWLALIRLYYREIAVTGTPPAEGPVILVANHPNGLLDPLVLCIGVDRPVAFLSKSTLFSNPLARRILRAFSAIPVYRAKEADTAQNEETFARCRSLLGAQGWLALFPEGISHDEPGLQPLKTGAARIALSSRAPGLRVVPVGMLYEDKEIFRSRVALTFGTPIEVAPLEPGVEPSQEAVRALTAQIADALSQVVLEAEDREIWRGLVAVAAWTSPDGGRDMGALDHRARALAAAYRTLDERDPERVVEVVEATRHYVRLLDAVGVTDPFALEVRHTGAPPSPFAAIVPLLPLVLLAPVALVGATLAWIPYRLVKPLALRLSGGHADLVGTLKLMLGLVILKLTWIAWAVAFGVAFGLPVGLAMLVIGPLSGFAALRWGERYDLRREVLHAHWLTLTREPIAAAVAEQRRVLAEKVEAGLALAGEALPRATAEPTLVPPP
ncbi:MAG: lysophospholipid acyltransferase family protein [Pseudomonadota bacterium]|nr:lysophospholipid acyltransferase family protein [Pseudomonadota bacterium]